MTLWLKAGNTAVITGGASGIGRAAAERYLQAGMNVAVADRDEGALDQLAREVPGRAHLMQVPCDVSDLHQLRAFASAVADRFGPVHCLMNNAGIATAAGLPWERPDAIRALLDVNLMGVVNGCHAFLPGMIAHGAPAAVINTGSKQGITRPPGNPAYNLSKAGVLAYTESIAHALREAGHSRVTAHLLIPGFVYTSMIARFVPQKPPAAWTPEQTVDFMITRLDAGDFYILCPDNETPRAMDEKRMQWTADDIIRNRPALSRWHPDHKAAFEAYMKAGRNDDADQSA